MDLYPDAKRLANADVGILEQDCTTRWELDNESLNAVFTSNFLEHLPTQSAVEKTLLEAHRALRPGGLFIAMGPNIRCVPGGFSRTRPRLRFYHTQGRF